MQRLSVEAKYRTDKSKSHTKSIRKQGYITGSVFGKGFEPVPIELLLEPLAKQIKTSESGITSLIDLKIIDAPENFDGTVIIKDFFKDPVTKNVLDIQFQRVSMDEKIDISVPVELIGNALGASQGGLVETITDELEIRCLPAYIPAKIEVDVSDLGLDDVIRVSDLKVDSRLEILTDENTVICTCKLPANADESENAESTE